MTALEGRPSLKPGCRLSPSGDTLLIPEGALKLQGPARRILELCDGTRTVPEIVTALAAEFQNVEPSKILAETSTFFSGLLDKGALELL